MVPNFYHNYNGTCFRDGVFRIDQQFRTHLSPPHVHSTHRVQLCSPYVSVLELEMLQLMGQCASCMDRGLAEPYLDVYSNNVE